MTKYVQEMQLWEILLLSFGAILFFALLAGFFIQLRQQKLKLSYAGFFMIPIIMIALPTIKNITVLGDFLKIETLVKTLEENPEDETARQELVTALENLPQEAQSAGFLITEAKAKTFIKDYDDAERKVNAALKKSPKNKEAKLTQARIQTAKAIEKLKKNPNDEESRKKYIRNVKKLQKSGKLKAVDKQFIQEARKLNLVVPEENP